MRLLSLLIAGLLSFSTLATTVETAKGLYAERGLNAAGIAKAQDAADLFATLATKAEGVEKVELLSSSYDSVGDKRKVIFESGDSVVEELLSTDSPANYSYQISDFSNFIGKLSSIAYGQLWFDNENGKTRITWNYSFKYRNIFAKIFLYLFLKMTYRKFMLQGLINVKNNLEKIKHV